MRVLVTGATGYIGSHTCVSLVEAGHEVIGVDNYANSSPAVADAAAEITGQPLTVHEIDLVDAELTDRLFAEGGFDAVIHFAGLKSVGESVAEPALYYRVNLGSTLSVVEAMRRHGVSLLVFSSSATVYGEPDDVPVTEDAPLLAINPYGQTKLDIERLLRSCADAHDWGVTCLRYFNPVGAHPSGLIGEAPGGVPANLVPYMLSVATGERPELQIYGDDYPTPDGTCLRDYIHVQDLADAHVAALAVLERASGWDAINIGTGQGTSVLEALAAGEAAVGRPIPNRRVDRRPGDAPSCYADPSKAADLLGWQASRTLDDMFADAWRWEQRRAGGLA